LSSAQGASRSSIVGRRLSDVATTAEPSIVESALGSACGGCAGGPDEPGDMPDHGRTREPGDDGAEASAVNQGPVAESCSDGRDRARYGDIGGRQTSGMSFAIALSDVH
jgi:hypothetical protein